MFIEIQVRTVGIDNKTNTTMINPNHIAFISLEPQSNTTWAFVQMVTGTTLWCDWRELEMQLRMVQRETI